MFVLGLFTEVCLKSIQRSKMELFAEIVNGFKSLTLFAKNSIVDVWLGSKYASEMTLSRDSINQMLKFLLLRRYQNESSSSVRIQT